MLRHTYALPGVSQGSSQVPPDPHCRGSKKWAEGSYLELSLNKCLMVVLKVSACCTTGTPCKFLPRMRIHATGTRYKSGEPHQVDSACRSALLWIPRGSEWGLHGLMHRLLARANHNSRLSATQRAPARVENDSLTLEDPCSRHSAHSWRKAALRSVAEGTLYLVRHPVTFKPNEVQLPEPLVEALCSVPAAPAQATIQTHL